MRGLDITFVPKVLYYILKLKIDFVSYQWLLWIMQVYTQLIRIYYIELHE